MILSIKKCSRRLAVVASHPIQYQAPLFRELARNLDVEVFFAHDPSPRDQAQSGFGVTFQWDVDLLSGYRHTFLRNISKKPGVEHFSGCNTPEIREYISSGCYDAVLVMGWYLRSMCQAVWAARMHRIPVLVRGDSQLITSRSPMKLIAKRLAYPVALRAFDAALYVGQRSREYYQHYGYPPERLFFSPHCVDTEWWSERATPFAGQACRTRLGIEPTDAVVLFAGKLVEFKHPLDVIAAVARLSYLDRRISIVVAGSGPLDEEMRSKAKGMNVTLHMLGFQNQTEMPAAYAAADVLVLPSSGRETWGLVVNEAIACGTAIVVSDAAGCAVDLAADNTCGRVYTMGDLDGLAAAIAEVLCVPPPLSAFAKKSKEYGLLSARNGIMQALETVTTRE